MTTAWKWMAFLQVSIQAIQVTSSDTSNKHVSLGDNLPCHANNDTCPCPVDCLQMWHPLKQSPKFRLDVESILVTALSLVYIISLSWTVTCLSSLKKGRVKLMICGLEGARLTFQILRKSAKLLKTHYDYVSTVEICKQSPKIRSLSHFANCS